jgi:hypothetical protein
MSWFLTGSIIAFSRALVSAGDYARWAADRANSKITIFKNAAVVEIFE